MPNSIALDAPETSPPGTVAHSRPRHGLRPERNLLPTVTLTLMFILNRVSAGSINVSVTA